MVKHATEPYFQYQYQLLNWFQDDDRPWILADVIFDGKSGCGILFTASVSNSVEIYAILSKLWAKMWISIWRPWPSWILSDMGSDGQNCSGTSFSVSVSNLVWIRSKWLWVMPWFQDGSRLQFTSGVNFIIWSFLQRVSIACYAERCISHSKSVRPSVRPSVCLTVRLSHAGTESKRLKLRSWGLHWRIAPWL